MFTFLPRQIMQRFLRSPAQAYSGTESTAFAMGTAHHTRRHSYPKHRQTLPGKRTAPAHPNHDNFQPSPAEPERAEEAAGPGALHRSVPAAPRRHRSPPVRTFPTETSGNPCWSAQPRRGQRWDRGEDSTCPAPLRQRLSRALAP